MKKILLFVAVLVFLMSITAFAGEPLKRNVVGDVSHPADITLKWLRTGDSQQYEITNASGGEFTFTNMPTGKSSDPVLDGEEYELIVEEEGKYTYTHTFTLKPVDPATTYDISQWGDIDNQDVYIENGEITLRDKYFNITGEGAKGMEIIIEKVD